MSGTRAQVRLRALLRGERERVERFGTLEETSVLILSIGASAV